MIHYEPLWKTIKEKNISTYYLIGKGVRKNTIYRLKKGLPITTLTLNTLCNLINCEPSDILGYTKDSELEQ